MGRAMSLGKCSFLTIVSLALPAHAAFITFDPDGPAPTNPAQTIGGLDWSVGNSLAKPLLPLEVGSTFQLYHQASLAGVINTNGTTVAPAGLNSTFELTTVSSVTAVVTSIAIVGTNTTFTYQLAPVQSPNSFVEIWYDNNPGTFANNLAGTGFNNGTRIFLGGPNPALTNLGNHTATQQLGLYDQFSGDDYGGKQSEIGSGGWSDENTVSSTDPFFFVTQPITGMSFNTSMNTPFKETNPSQLFAGLPGGAPPAILPALGAINGVSGPDFQFQSDANVTFSTPIPEPAGALGVAGIAYGLLARRRRVS